MAMSQTLSLGAGVIKFWGPHAIGAPVVNLGPPIHSSQIPPSAYGTVVPSAYVNACQFGYKTSAEYAESSMYHGGDREGKPIY